MSERRHDTPLPLLEACANDSNGANGAGLGGSHQTGWTGVVAKLIQLFGMLDPKMLLEGGKAAAFGQETAKGATKRR